MEILITKSIDTSSLTKICTHCEEPKKLGEFNKHENHKDGLNSWCKECASIAALKYRRTKKGLITEIYGSQKSSSKRRGMAMPTYSKKWLSAWLLNQPEFHRLYDIWVISGYKTDLIPSIDRIDDYLGYTEYNIQLMMWFENRAKGYSDVREGRNNKQNKATRQYTLDGKFVAEYHSATEAARQTGIYCTGIAKCRNGQYKTAGGFKWQLAS